MIQELILKSIQLVNDSCFGTFNFLCLFDIGEEQEKKSHYLHILQGKVADAKNVALSIQYYFHQTVAKMELKREQYADCKMFLNPKEGKDEFQCVQLQQHIERDNGNMLLFQCAARPFIFTVLAIVFTTG